VHIPFCARRCPYCAFYSEAEVSPAVHERYLDALERELTHRSRTQGFRAGEFVSASGASAASTVFVGGGTPTLLSGKALARLLRLLNAYCIGPDTSEITVEALPSTLSPEKAGILAEAGVGRVTLGLQSAEIAVLEGIGRAREYDALPRAVRILREAGISNIGLDLIIGLPGETRGGFRRGLEFVLGLECAHISAYILSIEAGTPFAEARRLGAYREAPDWEARRNYTHLSSALRRAGYRHYEVSNFALPGCACRHNLATWRGEALIGFGAGAVGTLPDSEGVLRVRRHNAPSIREYCARPEQAYTEEILSDKDLFNESLLLGLRTCEGISDDLAFAAAYGASRERLRAGLEGFVRERLLTRGGGRYRATLRGMLWLDAVLVELFL